MLKKSLFVLLFIASQLVMAQHASITSESRDILTYPYSDPNPLPIIAEGRDAIYPYFSFNGYSLTGQMQKWNVIKLENDYIEVYVLPSDGGKVWGAIEKSTGKEFIYRNEVMKYRNISMRGPWTSGGIELNFGFIGHNPSTCVPVDYKTVENDDGSVSCIVGSLDLPSRTKWLVEIRLPKDKAYFETRALWNNPTPVPQSYYNWMTAAAAVSDDLEFMYPGNEEIDHDGSAEPWPVNKDGRDLSKYANNAYGSDRSAHVVGEYNDFMGGYYHKSEFGFGHWALYDEMPGHKLWLWSQARSGAIWENLLTDTDGQYMEFQAGRMFNQYSPSPVLKTPITQVPFAPGITDRWKEIWFPVKAIGGYVDVSPMGVLNASHVNGNLQVGINALAFAKAKVTVKSGGKVIYSEDKSFKPMDVFQTSVPLANGAGYEVKVEGMDLQYNPDKRNLIDRPFVCTIPTDQITPASIYQQGMQEKEGRNYLEAKALFKSCLKKDPMYIEALAAMTEIYYRSNQYDSALYYAKQALQLDTYHPEANYFAGVTYHAKGDLINALETLGWAARSLEFRSTAYAQMAEIELQLENAELAEHYANQSLDFNRYNSNALQVLSILYRKAGKTALADGNIETMSRIDPLDHFADFERYLLHPSAENLTRFTATIKNELPYQTYLELCLVYYDLGLKDDALQVLEKAPAHPLITVWKAYIKNDPSMLDAVARESAAYVFPYRTETARALAWAMSKSSNWKFKYYLALNYWAIQRQDEARQLLTSCGQEPDYGTFYLTRASLLNSKDDKQVLGDLESAQRLGPGDWRTANRLIKYYESHQDNQKALALSTSAYKQFKGNFVLGLQYATELLNNGQYAACTKALEEMNILPSEGSSQGKLVYEQAYLLQALDLIKNKKYADALKKLNKSREWPETLGVGKPYEPDERIQNYLSAYCLKKLNRAKEAAAMQDAVVAFTDKQFTGRSPNNLLALLVYREKGETDAANKLLQKLSESAGPHNRVQRWITAVYKNDAAAGKQLEGELGDNNYLKIIKKVAEL
jgi:predicted Zn-dependent protease